MGQSIIKLRDGERDHYLIWSTFTASPYTFGMTLDELREYVKDAEGESGLTMLPSRLVRVERSGSSGRSIEQLLSGNRAGPGETEATLDEIVEWYCRSPWDCECGAGNAGFEQACWECGEKQAK